MKFLLSSLLLATFASAKPVPELGLDNLEATLKSHTWTCVLFFDRADERHYEEHQEMMSQLDDAFEDNDNVGFALLDIRAHPYYRAQYKFASDPHSFIHDFYTEFPDHAEDLTRISHRSFMNLKGDLYWPSRLSLFASDLNVYGEVDLDFHAELEARVGILWRWIEPTIVKDPENMEILLPSQIHKEREAAEENEDADNTFEFDQYFEKVPPPTKGLKNRFLLESGSVHNPDKDQGHYQYETWTIESRSDSEEWLDALAQVIDKYLIWAEGYETLWTAERKARENIQTNFGVYLNQMNTQIQTLINTIFDDPNYNPPSGDEEEEDLDDAAKARRMEVPHALKRYLGELVFGYGRSPASLREYLQGVLEALGATPAERRQARKTIDASQFALFQRMREYMKLVEEITRQDDRYLHTLADLVSQWHNILVQFQENINRYYVHEYLVKHPVDHQSFTRQSIQVLDMEDPINKELLSDYNEFNQRYTVPAIPVILGNVNMTNEVYTLDYLVEQCGAMDVTHHIRLSNPVGEKSSAEWGGLSEYKLDQNLLTDSRISVQEDDDGEEYEFHDRSLTLQQFVILSEKLGNLYLHDFSLPDECDRILHEETLYGAEQKFRIPSVVAAYDIFNRVTLYNYARSWPSLFIGKQGSNSKVHVDSGGSGFFMYLVSGRKRWVVYNPSERPFLYDRIHQHAFVPDVLGMDKSEEANEHLSKRFPLLHRPEDVYEVIQEPGQLIYIPPDSPHAVENLDDIVGVALNMGPREGLAQHLHDQIHAERKFGYTELALKYWLFADNAQEAMPTKDPLYMTFGEYKAQY